jgi:ELWxxDGT repeat protein
MVSIGPTTYFSAHDAVHGRELWKTDSTAAGTALVADLNPGTASSSPVPLTNANGTLLFLADDGTHGYELWKSDGTTRIKDIEIYSFTNVNGTLFFTASDDTHGTELWRSDGTAAGTALVKDINAGRTGSYPGSLTNVNGTLFFDADDGIHGAELWMLPPVVNTPAPSLGVSGFPATITAGTAGSFTVAIFC